MSTKLDKSAKHRNNVINAIMQAGFVVKTALKDIFATKTEMNYTAGKSGPNEHPILGKAAQFSGSPNTDSSPANNADPRVAEKFEQEASQENSPANRPSPGPRPGAAKRKDKEPPRLLMR